MGLGPTLPQAVDNDKMKVLYNKNDGVRLFSKHYDSSVELGAW